MWKKVDGVCSEIGIRWRTLDVTYKPFPVCAILQGPVSEIIKLSKVNKLDASEIARVTLKLSRAEAEYPGTDCKGPFIGVAGTLMSAQFCLALALSQGYIRGSDMLRFSDSTLKDLIDRIEVHALEEMELQSFKIEVDLHDGRRIEKFSNSNAKDLNWNRDQVVENLISIIDEMPISDLELKRICDTVLSAELHTVRHIVSTTISKGELSARV